MHYLCLVCDNWQTLLKLSVMLTTDNIEQVYVHGTRADGIYANIAMLLILPIPASLLVSVLQPTSDTVLHMLSALIYAEYILKETNCFCNT